MRAGNTDESRHRGSVIRLRPEYEERYVILHKHVFPGVLKRIRKSHVRNYSIFLLDGVLFSHLEFVGRDYEADMKAMGGDETTREWWKLTDPMQDPFPSRGPDEWWARMELISCYMIAKGRRHGVKRHCFTARIHPDSGMDLRNKFADFDGEPGGYFKQAHIHHQCVYVGLDRICVYLEYSGGDFANDDKKLNSHEKVVQWNEDVGRYLKEPWKEMREVFYTD